MRGLKKLLELQDMKTVESDVFRDALIQRFEFTFEIMRRAHPVGISCLTY